jgi:hypothetical protein
MVLLKTSISFCLKEVANLRDTKNMKSNAEIAIKEFRNKANGPERLRIICFRISHFSSVSAHKLEDNMTLEQVVSQFPFYTQVLLM